MACTLVLPGDLPPLLRLSLVHLALRRTASARLILAPVPPRGWREGQGIHGETPRQLFKKLGGGHVGQRIRPGRVASYAAVPQERPPSMNGYIVVHVALFVVLLLLLLLLLQRDEEEEGAPQRFVALAKSAFIGLWMCARARQQKLPRPVRFPSPPFSLPAPSARRRPGVRCHTFRQGDVARGELWFATEMRRPSANKKRKCTWTTRHHALVKKEKGTDRSRPLQEFCLASGYAGPLSSR